MKILFNFVALCVGFLMVLATVLLVTLIGAELLHMSPYETEARIVLFCFVLLGFLFFAWIAGRLLRSVMPLAQPQTQDGATSHEDARIIQEIYNGLTQMEKRIESLETIMIDKHREAPW